MIENQFWSATMFSNVSEGAWLNNRSAFDTENDATADTNGESNADVDTSEPTWGTVT